MENETRDLGINYFFEVFHIGGLEKETNWMEIKICCKQGETGHRGNMFREDVL